MEPKDRIIVALDVDTSKKALDLVDKLRKEASFFKIGFELFSVGGPDIVRQIISKGCRVFLDLKFHDIPNTVSKAAASVTRLGASILNLHALGGYDMMKTAAQALKEEAQRLNIERPKLIAVTVLTSMDENGLKKVGIGDNMADEVLRLARLAGEAGLDGVVASPSEAALIREALGRDFIIVTPGVRPSGADSGDQKRIATPRAAISNGATYIVVGRPITGSSDPAQAARNIIKEIGG